MTVVSDASPIINLNAIGHIELLRHLYGELLIPPAVYDEVTAASSKPGAEAVRSEDWIVRHSVNDSRLTSALLNGPDPGEAALAVNGNYSTCSATWASNASISPMTRFRSKFGASSSRASYRNSTANALKRSRSSKASTVHPSSRSSESNSLRSCVSGYVMLRCAHQTLRAFPTACCA